MNLKSVAIGLAAGALLFSPVYAEQGIDQQGVDQQESGVQPEAGTEGQQGDLGGGQSDTGIQGSDQEGDLGSQSDIEAQGGDQPGDLGGSQPGLGAEGSEQPGSDLGGAGRQGGAMQGGAALDSSTVQQIQTKLNEQGFDVGPVDGKFGPKTRQALRQFQQKQGIETTGQIDQQTLAALGVQEGSGSSGSMEDPQGSQPGDMGGGSTQPGVDQESGSQPGIDQGSGSDLGAGSQPESGAQGSDQQGSDLGGQSGSSQQDNSQSDSGTQPQSGTGM